MLIDSYETPGAENLLLLGRERHSDGGRARRLLITEAGVAALFIAAAGSLAVFASATRTLSVSALAVTVVAYLIAGRVQYPVGSSWTAPTQLVFVPMLFVLPTPYVPLIVAACSVADRLPAALRGPVAPTRLLARIGDSFYALGPALVLVVFGAQDFSWDRWPVLLLAFAAQVAFDAGAGLGRTWFAERVPPTGQLPMLWLYITDACLSCVGLVIAASAVERPGLVLLALPLVGLLGMLARERQQRLEYSLALTDAYRDTTALLAQSQGLTQELQKQSEELRETNDELHEKASLLSEQNRDIEIKNEEIELARRGLEEKAAQLALSSKYKSEFLANMSHELRTPLNSMLILSRLLAENEEQSLTDREVEFARTIHSAGNDLLSLINDILDLSKVEAGRMELDLAPVPLSDVYQDAERAFRHVAEQKNLSFRVEIDEALPGSVISDEQRLGQVLKNLLSNAFKFTHAGGVTLAIGLPQDRSGLRNDALREAERVIEFSVIDTGVGIPDDKLNLIFEAFQQADGTTSRKYGGTGLGLSISREIARLLGGEIQVDSTVGQGSRFSLFLPLIEHAADAPVDTRTDDPVTQIAVLDSVPELALEDQLADDIDELERGDRVVLVIDSDAERAKSIVEAVRARGAKAILARRASASLGLAREHHPSAVVLAGDLPRLESVLGQLKKHPDTRHLPVALVGDGAVRLDGLRAGAAAFIDDPVDDAGLEAALGKLERISGAPTRRIALIASGGELDEQIGSLLAGDENIDVQKIEPGSALEILHAQPFDLVVVAVGRPRSVSFALIREAATDEVLRELPLIAFVGDGLSKTDRARLDAAAKSAVITIADSPERLVDRAALFLHRAEATLPSQTRELLGHLRTGDAPLHGRKVLVIDDDIRNVFALTSTLEQRGMKVVFAENGREGIERLHQHPNTDVVLLDIMMPEMDGYQTARAIRSMPRFEHLPIISLTAKAMKGDREKAIAAGASDYITKPVDVDQLLSMMRVWLDA
jgi:signal transduction histidine kinase/DNA-binding response OmpR family regulator